MRVQDRPELEGTSGHGDTVTRGDALFVYEYFDHDFGDICRNGLRWEKIVIHKRELPLLDKSINRFRFYF